MFKEIFLWLDRTKRIWMIVTSLAGVVGVTSGLYGVANSQLFIVNVVEIVDYPENPPVSEQELLGLVNIPSDTVSLFSLRLSPIQERVLAHPWIKEVTLVKRFPQTIQISVKFRTPIGIYQKKSGDLLYIDEEAVPFAKANLENLTRVPILSGFKEEDFPQSLQKAVRFLLFWNQQALKSPVRLASLEWHRDGGFRALAISAENGFLQRFMIDFGDLEKEEDFTVPFQRILKVVNYLSDQKIPYRHIFADLGKKVVVKIPRRS
jgi:hypothetical protein